MTEKTCNKCGGNIFEQRAGKIIRCELEGVDEETGTAYRAIEWVPLKCSNPKCGQFSRGRTLVTATPKKRPATKKPPAPTKATKSAKKSAPTFARLPRKSEAIVEPVVSIPETTKASDYSTAANDGQQRGKNSRVKHDSRRRR